MGTRIDSLRLTATHPGAFVATLTTAALVLLGATAMAMAVSIVSLQWLESEEFDPSTCDLDVPSQACTDLVGFQYTIPSAQQVARTRAQLKLAQELATAQKEAALKDLGLAGGLTLPLVPFDDEMPSDSADPHAFLLAEQWMQVIEEPIPDPVVLAMVEVTDRSEAQVRADLERRSSQLYDAELEKERERRREVLSPAWERAQAGQSADHRRLDLLMSVAGPLVLLAPLLWMLALAAYVQARRWRAIRVVVSGRALQIGATWYPLHGCTQGFGDVLMIEASGSEVELPSGYGLTRSGWRVLREALDQGIRASAVAEDRTEDLERLHRLQQHA